jgi:two-component system alkaline phosphatase synthesis response regulator PhoP/two-component system response regulator ResD
MPRILVVDDEPDIVELAELYLRADGFDVLSAGTGPAALERVAAERPDLVVLDIMLPGMDGWEVCRRLRATGDVPIIFLTARGDPVDRVVGLELGADDYVVKPFHGRELVARVRTVLRRAGGAPPTAEAPIEVGDVSVDPARRIVVVAGTEVAMRAREFDLLLHMARHRGLVLTRDQLIESVWGYDFLGDSRTVDVHIAHVRSHLKGSQRVAIDTVWGVGYKLMVDGR